MRRKIPGRRSGFIGNFAYSSRAGWISTARHLTPAMFSRHSAGRHQSDLACRRPTTQHTMDGLVTIKQRWPSSTGDREVATFRNPPGHRPRNAARAPVGAFSGPAMKVDPMRLALVPVALAALALAGPPALAQSPRPPQPPVPAPPAPSAPPAGALPTVQNPGLPNSRSAADCARQQALAETHPRALGGAPPPRQPGC